jgi:hypothetical protein
MTERVTTKMRGQRQDPQPELAFLTPVGTAVTCAAAFGPDEQADGRTPLQCRRVRLDGGREVVQYRLAEGTTAFPATRDWLEHEIGVTLITWREYGRSEHRVLFPDLVGYNMDAVEPFALYAPPTGQPLAALAGIAPDKAQRAIARDLVLTVRLLEMVGLAHQGLSPATVLWTGEGAQLADLSVVARVGRRRTPGGTPPWAPPEQRAGDGRIDPRDALWSIGQLMHYLITGRASNGVGTLESPAVLGRWAKPFDGVFAESAANRPNAADLLRLLSCPDPCELTPPRADPLEAHRRDYDELIAAKRACLGLATSPDGAAGGGVEAGGRSRLRFGRGGPSRTGRTA